ncbi:MAG: dTMP kinase [Fervidobacterium sp.]
MFVSFEGIDGCGKSTQVSLFIQYLENNNIDYVKVREPGGTQLGEKIRELLINEEMCARSELLLFLSSRAQLVESVIKPALSNGRVVVADRFAHSSVVYQGCGRGLGVDIVEMLNNFATDMVYPDIVFLIDIPVDVAMKRMEKQRKDRIEKEGRGFWEKIRSCYLNLAKRSERFVVVDGNRDAKEIHLIIVEAFEKRFKIKS